MLASNAEALQALVASDLIHAHRIDEVCSPAITAMTTGDLGINHLC